jgi:hypothetical protein
MTLPPRITKAPKRSSRWRSAAHCNFIRSFACSVCHSTAAIEVAHVRKGSGAGIGQKPDDWRTVPLCRDHHAMQHTIGEGPFWAEFGIDVEALIEAFCKASPKVREIMAARNA